MNIVFNGFPVNVIKSKRKTVSIQLKSNEIIMRVPSRLGQKEILMFLNEKSAWIEKHKSLIAEKEEKAEEIPKLSAEELRALADKALKVIPEKVRHYAPIVGVNYGRITIRNPRTRWGSCSSLGNLNFNCLLMLAPDEVIDSVVVHELCHRKHMNHSEAFYDEVERVYPRYRECRKWLKENGDSLLRRLP